MTAGTQTLTYAEARARQRTHPLRQAEVPVEHAVSLPLPTRRWAGPGYAFFAAPATRSPERPPVQGPPDRWWVMDARGGLLVYARCAAVPFAPGASWGESELPPATCSLDELRQALQRIEERMNVLAPEFFGGRPGDPAARHALAEALRAYLPPPLQPQYRALAPDFFAWLEA